MYQSFDDRRKFPATSTFSPVRRQLLGAGLLATIVLAPTQPVFAHGGNGGRASDYRIEVTGFHGDPSGIEMRPVELGNRMELVRTTAKEVQILGYSGEPYLRLAADGVFENTNSPAHYLNLDRFARTPIPPTASATAAPHWVKLSDGTSIRWHDHRTHWMDTTPRQDVRDDPGVERVISNEPVALVVDGRSVSAIVKVTWLPPPPRLTWLVITSLAGCVLLAAFVLVPTLRRFAPECVVLASLGCLVGSGGSKFRNVASGLMLVLALVGWIIKNRWLPVAAATVVVVLAVTHFEVFEHRLLAGWAPAGLQRLGVTVALALAAAVVGAELVAGLGATAPVQPAAVEP